MADETTGVNAVRPPDPTPAPVTEAPAPASPPRTVAHDAFERVVAAKANLENQVGTLKAELAALTTRATEWEAKASKAESRFGAFTEFAGVLGTMDPEVVDLFEGKYQSVAEKDRPPRQDWVKALRDAPDTAPALVRPWLAPAVPMGQAPAPVKPPSPRVPGTPATPPAAPANVSAQEIARVREAAVKSGNWDEWKALRKGMGYGK